MTERISVPAVHFDDGRTMAVMLDADGQGVWTLDHEGADYWRDAGAELRSFADKLEADYAANPEFPEEVGVVDGYRLIATIADELERAAAEVTDEIDHHG